MLVRDIQKPTGLRQRSREFCTSATLVLICGSPVVIPG
jgi:hypothetical protein